MSTLTFTARASADPSKTKTRCAIVAVFGGELSATATALDSAGALSNTLKLGDFQGKPGQTHLLPGIGNAERVMLLGCGDRARFSHAVAREAFQGLSTALNASNV
ncbi:MAG TPA: leucyl aminopeptidase, partial [Halieaceae bacterium]|nr:leucyl aminopeptidase [Halieaceae bacterium]